MKPSSQHSNFRPCLRFVAALLAAAPLAAQRAAPVPPAGERLPLAEALARAAQAPDAAGTDALGDEQVARIAELAQRDLFRRVHVLEEEDGTIWARGRSYKAGFDARGATFIPFLGSDAPRNHPLRITLLSATAGGEPVTLGTGPRAERDGERIHIEHGVLDEVYELGTESIEHTFVVEERLVGELVLQVGLEGDFRCAEGEDGLEFLCDRGGVRYGHAFLRTADGERLPLPMERSSTGVAIRVPATITASAELPLVIDPIVCRASFLVEDGVSPDYHHVESTDIAYDESTSNYLIAYDCWFSNLDRDLFGNLFHTAVAPTGNVVCVETREYVFNVNTSDVHLPKVANLNAYDQFLVVAEFNGTGLVGWRLGANDPSGFVPGFLGVLSGSEDVGDRFDLGGDPYPFAPAFYCLVYDYSTPTEPGDVVARLVPGDASPLPPRIPIAVGAGMESKPGVSKSNAGDRWNIAWITDNVGDIRAMQLSWNGFVLTSPFAVFSDGQLRDDPRCSSPTTTGEFAVACLRWQNFVFGNLIAVASCQGSTVRHRREYSWNGNADGLDVDCDGNRFFLAWSEGAPSNSILGSRFRFEAGWIESEPFEVLENWNAPFAPSVTYVPTGGPMGRFAFSFATRYVQMTAFATIYDAPTGPPAAAFEAFCGGDGLQIDHTTGCPCGNNGAAGHGCANSIQSAGGLLAATGSASSDDVVLQASFLPITAYTLFLQHDARGDAVLADGVLCGGGTMVRLRGRGAVGGAASFPNPAFAEDATLTLSQRGGVAVGSGLRRYYSAWYRNAASSFCPPATANVTNGWRIDW